jgi:hypothetical protein
MGEASALFNITNIIHMTTSVSRSVLFGNAVEQLCKTRRVERHDAFSVFLDFFPAIVQILDHFTKLPNTRTPGAADATSLLYSICYFEFVVAIVIVQMCLAFMKGLSRSLQERSRRIVHHIH